jgi:collagen type III alpha
MKTIAILIVLLTGQILAASRSFDDYYFGPVAGYQSASVVTAAYYYVGADQVWTNLDGATSIWVEVWGAGGAASQNSTGHTGGGGGWAAGRIAITNGEALTIIVGAGGLCTYDESRYNYGGGAGRFDGNSEADEGGGRSAIRRADGTEVVTAGGGGGAGNEGHGGAGGGETGGNGTDDSGPGSYGSGGTQSVGGAGGIGISTERDGHAGTQYQGGQSWGACGGGGGGYYGGGGGGGYDYHYGGGGGGSGYTGGVFAGATNVAASGATPAGSSSALYLSGYGLGGTENQQAGSNGLIRILY